MKVSIEYFKHYICNICSSSTKLRCSRARCITITRRTIKKTKSDRFLIRKFWEDEGIGFNQSVFDLSDNYDRQQNNLMDRNRLIFVISVLERRVILSQLKYIPSFTVGHEKEGMVA